MDDFELTKQLSANARALLKNREFKPDQKEKAQAMIAMMGIMESAVSEAEAMIRMINLLPETDNEFRWTFVLGWLVKDRAQFLEICQNGGLVAEKIAWQMIQTLEPMEGR